MNASNPTLPQAGDGQAMPQGRPATIPPPVEFTADGNNLARLISPGLAGVGSPLAPPMTWSEARQPVYALCLRLLGHRQDAEDVAQESLVRGWKSLANWDQARPFLPWLLAIAANRCRTWMSGRSRRAIARGGEQPLEVVDFRVAPRNELAEAVQNILPGLKAEHRRAFILFHQQELSLDEVAAELGCPLGTAKTWLHRARKGILEALRAQGLL